MSASVLTTKILTAKKTQLKEYCERRGWTQRVGWFKDHASGAKRKRGALGLMMDEVREGTVDVVLTWKIDRLARSLNHLAQIIAELQTHKVALVCPSQGIDTTDTQSMRRISDQYFGSSSAVRTRTDNRTGK